eukprot:Lithocolla_globosa_v1_NODE_750_length_3334_cov_26.166819.p1 type:complete len:771 gc:universal NODE_750_length_3334_cov_26.166819:917-3229(+)
MTTKKTPHVQKSMKVELSFAPNLSLLDGTTLCVAAAHRNITLNPTKVEEGLVAFYGAGLVLEEGTVLFVTSTILRHFSQQVRYLDVRSLQWLEDLDNLKYQKEPDWVRFSSKIEGALALGLLPSGLVESAIFAVVHVCLSSFDLPKDFPNLKNWYESFLTLSPTQEGLTLFQSQIRPFLNVKTKVVALPPRQKVNPDVVQKVSHHEKIVLPVKGRRNVLITSALPYVNNVPHLGNIIGCVLSADVFARYCRLRDYVTLYVCGTDEYGTATETKALELGVTCQELCDRYSALHAEIYQWFKIDFDHFGRTTTKHQTAIAQDIFSKLKSNNLLSEQSMEQLLCRVCDRFLADRYVEGTCPSCLYEDARGDQCDKCGKLLNSATDLKNPSCKVCKNKNRTSDVVLQNSNHQFLDLKQLQPRVEEWAKQSLEKGRWSSNGWTITQSWFNEGLQKRCITRDLKWGTPVPLEGYEKKVFYVWFDAPIGYLSITANYTDQWEEWWKNPDDVQLYQFMGKDNVPFHTVIFPSSLLGSEDNYTLLHHVSTTEYLNYEGEKFSKSRGVGVFGSNVMETGIPSSVWRYYLLANRPEQNDSQFYWADFARRNNNELLKNLGNFVNRSLKFCKVNFGGEIPSISLTDLDNKLIEEVNALIKQYLEAMENVKLREGLRLAMAISQEGNLYLTNAGLGNALFEKEKERCATVIAIACNLVYLLCPLFDPFLPETSEEILAQLGAPTRFIPGSFTFDLLPGHVISEVKALFKPIEEKTYLDFQKKI